MRLSVSLLIFVSLSVPALAVQTPPTEGAPEPVFEPAALQPYFKVRDQLDAVRALGDGHPTVALRLLAKAPRDLPTRFVRAQALLASGDATNAAKEFESLAKEWPALSARAHCGAADAYESLGNLDRSIEHWKACADDPAHAKSAPLAAARLLERQKKYAAAIALLEPLRDVSGYGRAEALLLLAQIQAASGQPKAALETYQLVYVSEPASSAASQARTAMKALHAPVPTKLALDRIDKLLDQKQTRKAVRELQDLHEKPICPGDSCAPKRCHPPEIEEPSDTTEEADASDEDVDEPTPEDVVPAALLPAKRAPTFSLKTAHDDEASTAPEMPSCAVLSVVKPASPELCRAQLLRGWALSRSRRTRHKAIDPLRIVYASCADPDTRARALFYAQNAAHLISDPDAGDWALIDGLQFPENSLADDALMAAADRARDDGNGRLERQILHVLVRAYPDSDQRAEALFRIFWSHRAEGRPDRGLEYLNTLSREYEDRPGSDGGDAERGRYWWGRTVFTDAVPTDRVKGLEVLKTLARDRPTTYYGLLARSFLASVDPKHVVGPIAIEPYAQPLRMGLLAQDHAFNAAVALARLGEITDAEQLLLLVDFSKLHTDGDRGSESELIVAELLQHLGDNRAAHAIARRELLHIIRDGTNPLGRRAAIVCYPLAFRSSVSEGATEAGFNPDFLQGLMREESALNPMARSPVGARGLTQLMPATARIVARSLGLRRYTTNALWQPDTNIRIGSAYLGRLLKHFGHPGLAAAAYNAGPNAVSRWLASSRASFDEFVEEIPFTETRGYVKRVLRSYAAYSYLYGSPHDPALRVGLLLPPAAPVER